MNEEELKILIKNEINELKGNVSTRYNTLEKIEEEKIDTLTLNLDNDFNLSNFGIKSFFITDIDFIKFVSNIFKQKNIIVKNDTDSYFLDSVFLNKEEKIVYLIFKQNYINYDPSLSDEQILKNMSKKVKEVYCIGDFNNYKSYFKINFKESEE